MPHGGRTAVKTPRCSRFALATGCEHDRRMAKVALVMIARDEARCIERCLASVRAHVDEMLVLDTGSTDGTPELARCAGARVASFAWCDDFAAARNAALVLADADWSLVLDADEW